MSFFNFISSINKRIFHRKTRIFFKLRTPDYKDRHKNKTFVILAGGPSLSKYNEKIKHLVDQESAIVITVNNPVDFLNSHYHAFTNRKRFIQYSSKINRDSSVLLSPYFSRSIIKENYKGVYETLSYKLSDNNDFLIDNGIINSNCRTVAVLMIGVSIVMGADKIFIAGMDGYSSLILKGEKNMHHYGDKFDHASSRSKDDPENFLLDVERKMNINLDSIAQYLESTNKQQFFIVTPTVYGKHYKPIEGFL